MYSYSRAKNAEKVIKNTFRILKKPHANLQTIAKAPVKFQKDWPKTVGGVEGTRYLLKIRNYAPRTTHYGKPKTVSLRFSSKRRGTIKHHANGIGLRTKKLKNFKTSKGEYMLTRGQLHEGTVEQIRRVTGDN